MYASMSVHLPDSTFQLVSLEIVNRLFFFLPVPVVVAVSLSFLLVLTLRLPNLASFYFLRSYTRSRVRAFPVIKYEWQRIDRCASHGVPMKRKVGSANFKYFQVISKIRGNRSGADPNR